MILDLGKPRPGLVTALVRFVRARFRKRRDQQTDNEAGQCGHAEQDDQRQFEAGEEHHDIHRGTVLDDDCADGGGEQHEGEDFDFVQAVKNWPGCDPARVATVWEIITTGRVRSQSDYAGSDAILTACRSQNRCNLLPS